MWQDVDMREMSVREANQNFSRLIAEVEKGRSVTITKNGRPVAKVSPQRPRMACGA